jgi:hypothetical protein
MHSKNVHQDQAQSLPAQWLFDAKKVLNESYRTQCEKEGYAFDINGMHFEKELVVAISYYHPVRLEAIPLTCTLSMEVTPAANAVQKLSFMVDAASIFFDSYFSDEDWDGHSAYWQEATHKKDKFYYQITRENIALTMEADRILAAADED